MNIDSDVFGFYSLLLLLSKWTLQHETSFLM